MGDAERASIAAKVVNRIAEVPAAAWDRCAGDDNPFLCHAFLDALEESGCVRPETGWAPYHLVIEDPGGGLSGAVPMYLKSHSRGEYIFDWGWADAYERAGGQYYPKLLVAVPFTPVTGARLLAPTGPGQEEARDQLLAVALEAARQLGVSSLHFNFLTEPEWRQLGEHGLLQRTDQQFHWVNRGYERFDEFLADLASRKRKTIRKEREAARASDIEIRVLTGSDIREAHWDAFFQFYMDTGSRKWGRPYLNRRFFSLLGERMADRVALIMCRRAGRDIAGALNLIGADTLYGRYWGCVEDHRFLHFEACYYQAIDFAIERGLKTVEAGAQGPHKLARGYSPTHVYSAHWLRDSRFRRAVADYLAHERREVDESMAYLRELEPFRRGQEQD